MSFLTKIIANGQYYTFDMPGTECYLAYNVNEQYLAVISTETGVMLTRTEGKIDTVEEFTRIARNVFMRRINLTDLELKTIK